MLSTLGACCTYKKSRLFEEAACLGYTVDIEDESFSQFIFDNADFNINNIDGCNTFHAMGGIQCITPKSAVNIDMKLPVKTKSVGARELGSFGDVTIRYCAKPKEPLKTIIVEDLNKFKFTDTIASIFQPFDVLWLCGPWLDIKNIPNWSGVMSLTCQVSEFYTSYIKTLPFINLNPSDVSTIYTTLHFALEESRKQGLEYCIVTFDQPLFQKAFEIISCHDDLNSSNIILRLGGFHLLMSFLGTIGHCMKGSGLEDLLELIYAKASVPQALSGHAFNRAVRAHTLILWALINHFLAKEGDSICTFDFQSLLRPLYEDLDLVATSNNLRTMTQRLNENISKISQMSRTSKLWCQYINQVTLMLHFISAERTGDFKLHLQCIIEMIPYFHCAGHQNYAKSAHLYLQSTLNLQDRLLEKIYEKYVSGEFTIRRSEKEYSGIWSDMTIEQTLMRSLKTGTGGLTHGRGLTSSTLAQFVRSFPVCEKVIESLEVFSDLEHFSEIHRDLRDSRKTRNLNDFKILLEWFDDHSPFFHVSEELISISSGVSVKDEKNLINCDNVQQIAEMSLQQVVGKPFSEFHVRKTFKVKTLGDVKVVGNKVNPVDVNPQQFFNRVLLTMRNENDLKTFFEHELSTYPPYFFSQGKLRKGNKSVLISHLCKDNFEYEKPETLNNPLSVIDGGCLLHKIVWPKLVTFGDIFKIYCNYVIEKFGFNSWVIFDGYSEKSTKDEEHRRRQSKITPRVEFQENTLLIFSQADFLSNTSNKERFISYLAEKLKEKGIKVTHTKSDCDSIVASTAISECQSQDVVVFVNDTDVIVMLFSLAKKSKNQLYVWAPSTSKALDKFLNIFKLQSLISEQIRENLLFIHAFTGCDTTSYPYKMGKKRIFDVLKNNPEMFGLIKSFNTPDMNKATLSEVGQKLILKFFPVQNCEKLNNSRLYCYKQITSTQGLGSNFDLANLPPTEDSSDQHIFRVYLQVQSWRGNDLDPLEWGWFANGNELFPVTYTKPPGPEHLMATFFCKCKDLCTANCVCASYNRKCSILCKKCNLACLNAPRVDYEEVEIDDDV